MTFTRNFEKFMDFDLTSNHSISVLSEQNGIKLMCFIQLDLIYINKEDLKNRDITGSRKQ